MTPSFMWIMNSPDNQRHETELFGFYGISTFVGYLMPNPFLYKLSVLFQTIQFSVSTVSMSKIVLFLTIQFCISTQLKCQNYLK